MAQPQELLKMVAVKFIWFLNLLWVLAATFVFVTGMFVAVQIIGPLGNSSGGEDTNGTVPTPSPIHTDPPSLVSLLPDNASAALREWAEKWSGEAFTPDHAVFNGSLFFNGKSELYFWDGGAYSADHGGSLPVLRVDAGDLGTASVAVTVATHTIRGFLVLTAWSLAGVQLPNWEESRQEELKSWAVVFVGVSYIVTKIPFEDLGGWICYAVLTILQMVLSALVSRTVPMVAGAIGLFVLSWKFAVEPVDATGISDSEFGSPYEPSFWPALGSEVAEWTPESLVIDLAQTVNMLRPPPSLEIED